MSWIKCRTLSWSKSPVSTSKPRCVNSAWLQTKGPVYTLCTHTHTEYTGHRTGGRAESCLRRISCLSASLSIPRPGQFMLENKLLCVFGELLWEIFASFSKNFWSTLVPSDWLHTWIVLGLWTHVFTSEKTWKDESEMWLNFLSIYIQCVTWYCLVGCMYA